MFNWRWLVREGSEYAENQCQMFSLGLNVTHEVRWCSEHWKGTHQNHILVLCRSPRPLAWLLSHFGDLVTLQKTFNDLPVIFHCLNPIYLGIWFGAGLAVLGLWLDLVTLKVSCKQNDSMILLWIYTYLKQRGQKPLYGMCLNIGVLQSKTWDISVWKTDEPMRIFMAAIG